MVHSHKPEPYLLDMRFAQLLHAFVTGMATTIILVTAREIPPSGTLQLEELFFATVEIGESEYDVNGPWGLHYTLPIYR